MLLRTGIVSLKWLGALCLLGGLFWAAYQVHQRVRATEAEEKTARPLRASEKSSDRTLKLPEASAQAHGLKYAAAEEAEWREQVVVYGRVVVNPAATVTVQ